jgi:hypothetical protein
MQAVIGGIHTVDGNVTWSYTHFRMDEGKIFLGALFHLEREELCIVCSSLSGGRTKEEKDGAEVRSLISALDTRPSPVALTHAALLWAALTAQAHGGTTARVKRSYPAAAAAAAAAASSVRYHDTYRRAEARHRAQR